MYFQQVTHDPPSRQEVVQYKEDNDYIRVLQQQLQQVQKEVKPHMSYVHIQSIKLLKSMNNRQYNYVKKIWW